MAVISIAPIAQGRGGGRGEDNRGRYTKSWLIRTNDAYDEAKVVMAACPDRIGDPYSNGRGVFDDNSFCVAVRPDPFGDRNTWHVFCDFKPLDKSRITIRYSFEKKKVALTGVKKVDVQAPSQNDQYLPEGVHKSNTFVSTISNSYGDAFDPAPEYEKSYPVISFRRREDNLNTTLINRYADAVNDEFWCGANSRCAKMLSIEADHEYIFERGAEKKIWWVTYKIGFDEDTWDVQKLDAGYHFKFPTGHALAGQTGNFVDTDGNPRIGLLSNEVGAAGIKGIALVDLTKPEFKTFEVNRKLPFGVLGLPQNVNIFEPLV